MHGRSVSTNLSSEKDSFIKTDWISVQSVKYGIDIMVSSFYYFTHWKNASDRLCINSFRVHLCDLDAVPIP